MFGGLAPRRQEVPPCPVLSRTALLALAVNSSFRPAVPTAQATIPQRRLNKYSSNFLAARKFTLDKRTLAASLNPGAAIRSEQEA
jgi:hypothetical protein